MGELIPVASERSTGGKVRFKGKDHVLITLEQAVAAKPDIALFSAGCLLYTSDAADDLLCVDLGGRRIIKKKNKINKIYSK